MFQSRCWEFSGFASLRRRSTRIQQEIAALSKLAAAVVQVVQHHHHLLHVHGRIHSRNLPFTSALQTAFAFQPIMIQMKSHGKIPSREARISSLKLCELSCLDTAHGKTHKRRRSATYRPQCRSEDGAVAIEVVGVAGFGAGTEEASEAAQEVVGEDSSSHLDRRIRCMVCDMDDIQDMIDLR